MLSPRVFDIDVPAEIERIGRRLRAIVGGELHRRGAVLGLSGGVDSAVCAALAARALGPGRVLGLLLPERESSPDSARLGRRVAEGLGIECLEQDITPALEAVGCYATRDAAIRIAFPDYAPDWKCKIVVRGGPTGRLNYFDLVVRAPDGRVLQRRLGPREYLRIIAATNYKQRIRKSVEYHHADCRVYAVLGTPNRLEYDQGFFVKNGDGSADVKPIAHLYKTQVYQLAEYLGRVWTKVTVPEAGVERIGIKLGIIDSVANPYDQVEDQRRVIAIMESEHPPTAQPVRDLSQIYEKLFQRFASEIKVVRVTVPRGGEVEKEAALRDALVQVMYTEDLDLIGDEGGRMVEFD